MKADSNKITSEQAQLALNSLGQATKGIENICRPPLWLNLVASLLLGLETFAVAYSSGNSIWTFILIVATTALLLVMAGWFFTLRQHGVRLNLQPTGVKDKVLSFSIGMLVAFVIVATQYFYQAGYIWLPVLAAVLNGSVLFYTLYKFPMGQSIPTGGANE